MRFAGTISQDALSGLGAADDTVRAAIKQEYPGVSSALLESIVQNTAQFSQLDPELAARFIARSTKTYIAAGGKTTRAIVNLQFDQGPNGETIAVPYTVTYLKGYKWKCQGNMPMSDQIGAVMVANGLDPNHAVYCGPDSNRALKAFAMGAIGLVLGVAIGAYLSTAASVAGTGAATGATGAASAGTAAAVIPAGVETVVVTAAAPALVPGALTVAGLATGTALTAATSAPPPISQPSVIETVTTTASALPTAAPVATAVSGTVGAAVASGAVIASEPAAPVQPIETVTSEATRIEQIPVDSSTTLATGLTSVGIAIPTILSSAPPPIQVDDAASGPGVSDAAKSAIGDALQTYGAQWVQDHLVDLLADANGVYPTDQEYADAQDWIAAGAGSGVSKWVWLALLAAGGAAVYYSSKHKKVRS